MKKIVNFALASGMFAVASSEAAVVINLVQNGNNTHVSGSGSVNLASTTGFDSTSVFGQTLLNVQMNSSNNSSFTGVVPLDPDRYNISNAVRTGPVPTTLPPAQYIPIASGGAHVTIQNGTQLLLLPKGYTTGSPIDFSASAENWKFTTFGYKDGDVIDVAWSNGGVSDSLRVNFSVIPEPSTCVLVMGAAAFASLRRSRIRS